MFSFPWRTMLGIPSLVTAYSALCSGSSWLPFHHVPTTVGWEVFQLTFHLPLVPSSRSTCWLSPGVQHGAIRRDSESCLCHLLAV